MRWRPLQAGAEATGGVGGFRRADGIGREIEALAACAGTTLSDRRAPRRPTLYLVQRAPGHAGSNQLLSLDGIQTLPGKVRFPMRAGDILTIVTPRDGGWGAASPSAAHSSHSYRADDHVA